MNDKDATTRGDLRIPDGELGDKIREEFEKGEGSVIVSSFMSCFVNWLIVCLFVQVTVMSAVGEECIIAYKNAT